MSCPDIPDTIAAVATPPGVGGIGVLRISGPETRSIAAAVIGNCPKPRQARFAQFRDAAGDSLDHGLALFFPAPASFTGEDVLELQGHGGPVIMDRLLQRALELGARPARPGEFSERAFLNDKLDLAQAEAIADLIEAGTAQAAAAAMRSLEGTFSRAVTRLADNLVELRVYVEAAIDFPDEEVDFLAEGQVRQRLEGLREQLSELQEQAERGSVLREGLRLVIAGQPNVGKSSLLNRLAGRESAIVTEIPGTTRDVLREQISLDGLPLHVVDTAGLRDSEDPVEIEGVRRARSEIAAADRVLLVVDDRVGISEADTGILADLPPSLPVSIACNKCDLSGRPPEGFELDGRPALRLSATTGAGLEALVRHLQEAAGYAGEAASSFSARRRHLHALARSGRALDRGWAVLVEQSAGELLAEELRSAHTALGEITGEFSSEDLLGEIFASFCIGK